MPRPKVNGPTERELEILRILWARGPSSVRAVLESINHEKERKVAYTSVLTVMSIMQTKGLLSRSEVGRTHIYSPLPTQGEIEQKLVEQFINVIFDGSAMRLVSRALSVQVTSDADADRIAELLSTVDDHDAPK